MMRQLPTIATLVLVNGIAFGQVFRFDADNPPRSCSGRIVDVSCSPRPTTISPTPTPTRLATATPSRTPIPTATIVCPPGTVLTPRVCSLVPCIQRCVGPTVTPTPTRTPVSSPPTNRWTKVTGSWFNSGYDAGLNLPPVSYAVDPLSIREGAVRSPQEWVTGQWLTSWKSDRLNIPYADFERLKSSLGNNKPKGGIYLGEVGVSFWGQAVEEFDGGFYRPDGSLKTGAELREPVSPMEMILANLYQDAGYRLLYAPYIHNGLDIVQPTTIAAYKRLFYFARWIESLRYHLPGVTNVALQAANCVAWTPAEEESILPWAGLIMRAKGIQPEIQLERCVAGDGPGPAELRPVRADCATLDIARHVPGAVLSMWDHAGLVALNYLSECQ